MEDRGDRKDSRRGREGEGNKEVVRSRKCGSDNESDQDLEKSS